MRLGILATLIIAIGVLAGCNSRDMTVSQAQNPTAPSPQTNLTPPPVDNARRITVAEAHDLWQKGNVLIIDTRGEPAFEQSHIKGAISIPTQDFPARAGELPRNKMIVTYCT